MSEICRIQNVLFLCIIITIWKFIVTQEQSSEEMFSSQSGYYLENLDEVAVGTGIDTLECPSKNVITTRYKCNVDGKWIECSRKHCCKDFTFIAGRAKRGYKDYVYYTSDEVVRRAGGPIVTPMSK